MLNKLISVHNTLYQLEVSGNQTVPVVKCIMALQEVIGEVQTKLMSMNGKAPSPVEEEVNANVNGGSN